MFKPVSRILYPAKSRVAIICLGLTLPLNSSGLPESIQSEQLLSGKTDYFHTWPCSKRGLSWYTRRYTPKKRTTDVAIDAAGSYPVFSPLPPVNRWRYIFCDTFRSQQVTLLTPGCYPALCSMEFGLSSAVFKQQLPGLNISLLLF